MPSIHTVLVKKERVALLDTQFQIVISSKTNQSARSALLIFLLIRLAIKQKSPRTSVRGLLLVVRDTWIEHVTPAV